MHMNISTWMAVATVALSSLTIRAQPIPTVPEVVQFRSPQPARYRIASTAAQRMSASSGWVKAYRDDGSTNSVEFGSRVVIQLDAGADLQALLAARPLELSRVVRSNVFVLQAPDAWTAIREAQQLSALAGVAACYPVMQRDAAPHGPYAPRSNDPFAIPYFITGGGQTIEAQWPIENREGNSVRRGLDLNVMAAWPYGTGQGVVVAVADSGLEMNHPELTNRLAGTPHFNFSAQNTNAGPIGGGQFDPLRAFWSHGTEVAGLIAAQGNNAKGITGVAPGASLASWLIYTNTSALVSDEALMDMFQYASNVVSVQNHSWGAGNGLKQQRGPTLLEQIGIANAVTLGRGGRGEVLVRSAGNDRAIAASTCDDGYVNDPQVMAVAAVTQSGRATSYSEAGACVLLGAPGGGGDTTQGLFTLDLVGSDRGVNSGIIYGGDIADYVFGVQGFVGTSASAPLVSGVAALVLSANTNLSYRDVQHILLLSARHWDGADPDLATNGAGLVASHNVGFGVPDAGHAAWLATIWSNRPALTTLTMTDSQPLAIPDDGLRIEVSGSGIPAGLESVHAFPTFAPHPDAPTASVALVDVGVATNVPPLNLTNKGALILRDTTAFATKISNVARAGAAFAVIYNSTNGGSFNLGLVTGTEYAPIPAVFIGNSSGEALKALFQTNGSALARLRLLTAEKTFQVNSTLLCEQVGVRVQSDHPLRGDLRITLQSPQGTRSVLQHFNDDTAAGPTDWTYWTTHHFLESSAGNWTVAFADEFPGAVGSVQSVSLILRGTQVTDADHDGLADTWESSRLGSLGYGPKDDPDRDGYSNAREQLMGTDPMVSDLLGSPNLSRWSLFGSQLMRVSWASAPQYTYELRGGTNVTALNLITNLPGGFPETEWFAPYSASQNGFFKVNALQSP
jgi:subtilisin family serine protease/subtilisin-like proprotein convertase family protein